MSTNSNKIISLQELINAQVDAYKLELIMNEAPWVEVTTRLGRKCYSIATIQGIIDQYKLLTDQELDGLRNAIEIAAAAGAGANGWIDKLIQTWSGRTQEQKNKDMIFVEDFGAIGDGKLHKLSEKFSTLAEAQAVYPFVTSLNQSIDWAAFKKSDLNSNGEFYGRANVYCLNEYLELNNSFLGQGYDAWNFKASPEPRFMDKGTTILFCETPTIFVNVVNVSNCSSGGGVIKNGMKSLLEVENFDGNSTYSLLDYTNADAVGAQMATPKNLKVAVRLNRSAKLRNCRIQVNYDGVSGYNYDNGYLNIIKFPQYKDNRPNGLGDEWDIGVLSYNTDGTGVESAQIVGYWRMAARAVVSSSFGNNDATGAIFKDNDILYHGYNGLSIRSNDTYRIISGTTNTCTLPWSASHQIPKNGYCNLGGTNGTFTGSTFNSNNKTITLTGVSFDCSSKAGKIAFFGNHSGFAGSSIDQGVISGLQHFSNYRAYDTFLDEPFNYPSKAREISGVSVRDIDFINVHLFDTDIIEFIHCAQAVGNIACYAEAQGFETSKGVLGEKGARCIVSCPSTLTSYAQGDYPAGDVNIYSWDAASELTDGSIDLYPMYRSASSRFALDSTYYFMPNNADIKAAGYWTERDVAPRRFDVCSRAWMTEALGGTQKYFEIVDGNLKRYMRIDGINDYVGFGITNPSVALHIARPKSPTLLLDQTDVDTTVDPAINLRNSIGSWVIRPQASSINQLQVRYDNKPALNINKDNGTLFSGVDNTADIGTANNRYKTVYATTGAISTSDERLKQQFRTHLENEKAAALEIKSNICLFKFNDAVDLKGDGARWHCGVKAQQVVSIMQNHGLDPFSYAFVCFDEWDEQEEIIESWSDEFNEDGELIREAGFDVIQKHKEAGNRYGIRYDELAMFILASI